MAVAAAEGKSLPAELGDLCAGVTPTDEQRAIAASLAGAEEALILLGNLAGRHAASSAVRSLAAGIGELTGAKVGTLSEGANSAGLSLVGALPHRKAGGTDRESAGLNTAEQINSKLDALVLLNVEPDADVAGADVVSKLANHGFVVALTPFDAPSLREGADLMLPIGTFAETSGTYVNVAGTPQSFEGIANPVGEARPAWKVLRVLGNMLDAAGFEYVTSEDVVAEVRGILDGASPDAALTVSKVAKPNGADAPSDEIDVPLYSVDSVVRRARALQLTPEARRALVAQQAGESE